MSTNSDNGNGNPGSIILEQPPFRVTYNRRKRMITLIDDWSDGGPYSVDISAHLWPALARTVNEHIDASSQR